MNQVLPRVTLPPGRAPSWILAEHVYQLLLYVHIVSAVIWVGGAFAIQALAILVLRSDDPMELPRLLRNFEIVGSRLFMPAATVLFLAGAVMTIQK